MIFNRERGMRRESPKADVLAVEPAAVCKTIHEGLVMRFEVKLGERTLGRGISSGKAWSLALKKLKMEREVQE